MEKHKQLYNAIIENAKKEELEGLRVKGNGNYYEAHHTYFSKMFRYQKVVCPKCGKQETIDYNEEEKA